VKVKGVKVDFGADCGQPGIDINGTGIQRINTAELVHNGQPHGDRIKIQIRVKANIENIQVFQGCA